MTKLKIVFAEDDALLSRAVNVQLLDEGFKVLSAADGESALKLIKKELPDLVLLDIIMPKLQGLDVLKALKKDAKTKKIPVIMLTNLDNPEDRATARKYGALDYYVKASVDLDELTKKIKKIVSK
jgi:DNA-binding response OmpR family regulator